MATGNNGWNRLSQNPNGFMTDQVSIGNGVGIHHTINMPTDEIGKSHNTIDIGPSQIKIYPDGNTSLRK